MKVMKVVLVCCVLMLSGCYLVGCTNYSIKQNSDNGLKCADQDLRGNSVVKTECKVDISVENLKEPKTAKSEQRNSVKSE